MAGVFDAIKPYTQCENCITILLVCSTVFLNQWSEVTHRIYIVIAPGTISGIFCVSNLAKKIRRFSLNRQIFWWSICYLVDKSTRNFFCPIKIRRFSINRRIFLPKFQTQKIPTSYRVHRRHLNLKQAQSISLREETNIPIRFVKNQLLFTPFSIHYRTRPRC